MTENFYGIVKESRIVGSGSHQITLKLYRHRDPRINTADIFLAKDPCFEVGDFIRIKARATAWFVRAGRNSLTCIGASHEDYQRFGKAKEMYIDGGKEKESET